MGAVHGVYLKYVGLSAISFCGYHMMVGTIGRMDPLTPLLSLTSLSLSSLAVVDDTRTLLLTASIDTNSSGSNGLLSLLRLGLASILGYSTLINGAIAILFKLRRGMCLVGKNRTNGTIPLWSYVILFPFHISTLAYTYIHTKYGTMNKPFSSNTHTINEDTPQAAKTTTTKVEKSTVPVASEVQPGWWVGGCYSNRLNMHWAGVVDCTVEFPERCKTVQYLCLPTWDGVPATPEQLDKAAKFCIDAIEEWNRLRESGLVKGEPNILIHCAHGRGRSTTVMCAALVKMGYFTSYEEALVVGIQPSRPCCKLNKMMKTNLAEWQRIYMDGKKDS